EMWNERVLGDLRATRAWIREARRTRHIALSGNRRLSASLAIGFIFSAVSGFSVETMYRGQVWATDAHPNGSTPAYPFIQAGSSEDVRGERLVVSIGIIRDIAEEVEGDLGRHGLAGIGVHLSHCLEI